MHATDIVAYTYQAETLCPLCTYLALTNGESRDAGIDRHAAIRDIGAERGFDVDDERSFDSGDFPKVVFVSQIEYEAIDVPDDSFIGQGWRAPRCDSCGEEL